MGPLLVRWPGPEEVFEGLVQVQHCIWKITSKVHHRVFPRHSKPEQEVVLRRQEHNRPYADGAIFLFLRGACRPVFTAIRDYPRAKSLVDALQRQFPRNEEQLGRADRRGVHGLV